MFITKEWQIKTDPLNIKLYHVSKRSPYGYYSTIKEALHGLVEHEVKSEGLEDLKRLDAKLDALHDQINTLTLP